MRGVANGGRLVGLVVLVVLASARPLAVGAEERPAGADLASPLEASRGWAAGIQVRTDLATRLFRAGASVRLGQIGQGVVFDPLSYAGRHQSDTDLLLEWLPLPAQWAAVLGWRLTAVPVLGQRYLHERLVVGVSAPLPRLGWRHLRFRFGVEVAFTLVKHGGDLPTRTLWDRNGPIDDYVNYGLTLQGELGGAF
jgi:hypothetical protein